MDRRMLNKLNDIDEIERCDAIEYLSSFLEDDEIAIELLNMFNDRNYLVRCEAYDAFYGYNKKNIINNLIEKLQREKSKYARMYICSTLSSIVKFFPLTKKQNEAFLFCYIKEKEVNVLIGFWTILYLIEKNEKYVIEILNCINHNDYHIRCNAINFLYEVIDDKNKNLIIAAVNKRLNNEEAKSVKSLIESFVLDNS